LTQTRGVKKIPKIVLKTTQNQRNHEYFGFRKIPLWPFSEASNKCIFQCFWKIHWGLSQEPDVLKQSTEPSVLQVQKCVPPEILQTEQNQTNFEKANDFFVFAKP
jgi:hypothetical protein